MHSALLRCQLACVLQLKRHVRLVFGLTESALGPCSRPHESFLFLFLAAFRSDGRQRRLLSVFFFPSVLLRAGSVLHIAFIRLCYYFFPPVERCKQIFRCQATEEVFISSIFFISGSYGVKPPKNSF